ncbi:DUF2889 domain-containing protein [Pseudomaricurvus sp. HS19]|uniref:DUF2889 domain-containing protein n=1 Tax=Pseudomaricurvus sp. HS19 TaxID=2692626 RepID=UPI001371ED61|nr:DUF2889 domain-containing protein [Pseudomaricurvus sp. HS19]MYM64042.1 DUF2889 domain-containing protein [Pseudomaricurvus sp. HS19]
MSAGGVTLDALPGFRRRFRITPAVHRVCCEVEDDFHCMEVTLHHAGGVATRVEALMHRAPWTTCPGAQQKVQETFTGVRLDEFVRRGEKKENCTHLYDLALLAAGHAQEERVQQYDILVSDPDESGVSQAALRLNDVTLLHWIVQGFVMVEPSEAAGIRLDRLNDWIAGLDAPLQEPARLLRWAIMIAHGRSIPMEEQSDATRMPPNCYTFQPHRAVNALRVGLIRDFSNDESQPLDNNNYH